MARPTKVRHICCNPEANYFKPRGIPVFELEEIILAEDELEAIRLADLESFYQEQAAKEMQISRQTFGNIIRSARKKIADTLVNGKALKIEGGMVAVKGRAFLCKDCEHKWTMPLGTGRPHGCPKCQNKEITRCSMDQETCHR